MLLAGECRELETLGLGQNRLGAKGLERYLPSIPP